MSEKSTFKELEQGVEDLKAELGRLKISYRAIVDDSRDAILLTSPEGGILFANPAACELFQMTEQELIDGGRRALVDTSDPRWPAALEELAATGQFRGELTFKKKDGSQFAAEMSSSVFPEAENKLTSHTVIRDLTHQRQAKDALKVSEEVLGLFFEYAPVSVAVLDRDMRYTAVSRRWMTAYGLGGRDIAGRSHYEVFPEIPERWKAVYQRCLAGEVLEGEEDSFVREDGAVQVLNWKISPWHLANGEVGGIIIFTEDITERERTEVALRESERKWKNILINTPQIGIALNPQGKIVFANERFLQLTGWKRSEVLGQDWFEMFIPQDIRDRIQRVFRTTMSRKDTLDLSTYENQIMTRDNNLLNVAWSNTLTTDAKGNIVDITCLGVDLTERKRAEDTLRDERQRLSDVLKGTNAGIWEWNVQTGETIFNERWAEIIGYTLEEISPASIETWMKFCHPDDLKTSGELLEKHFRGELDYYECEARMRHKSGSWVWILDRGRVISWTEGGKPEWMYGTHQDITNRKRADEALRENERRFRDIFESSPMGMHMYQLEPDGRLVFVDANPAADIILGMSNKQFIGKTIEEAFPPLAGTDVPEAYRRAARDGIQWNTERIVYEGDKMRGAFYVHAFQTTPGKMAAMFMDITDRKRAEAERENLQNQLIQAQKMEAVGRLAGGVAHDFNNMLSVIIGHAGMALGRVDPSQPLYTDLEEIRKAGERSADLIRQLLGFARKQTVAPKVIDLNKTVAGMTKMLQRLIGEDIDLAWLPGKNVWPVKMDPSQIDQILANLCVNARDAIADVGKVTIETGNASFDENDRTRPAGCLPGEYVLLAVSDTGCGMDAETLDNIFEPFFTTKESGRGTGLGLATVYGVVKQNNGFVDVDSEPDRGAIFKVYLPRYRTRAHFLREKGKDQPTERGHETILLVEDEPAILRMTAMMLESLGYQVVTARTPGEAIRLAREHTGEIHLLVTDVVMPEMNGRDLARNILSIHPGLKRLFMSGYTADVIADHGVLDAGVNFIQKPFSMKKLGAKVRDVLDENRA